MSQTFQAKQVAPIITDCVKQKIFDETFPFIILQGLEAEIKAHLEELYKDTRHVPILTQVHEPGRWIKIRGVHMDVVAQFLLSKGL